MKERTRRRDKPRDSGALLTMPPCIDCKKPWTMFESEKTWWDELVLKFKYTFPIRCPDCRRKKKARKNEEHKSQISGRLNEIAENLDAGMYDQFAEEGKLAQELREIAEQVEGLERSFSRPL